MRHYSYGIIPLRLKGKQWEVLLVRHQAGHWSFPKGHAQANETPKETAERELKEETGLTVVSYLGEEFLEENYYFFFKGDRVYKTVRYFMAHVEGDIRLQEAEISESRWLPLAEAANIITFKEGQKVCRQTEQLLAARILKEKRF